MDKDIVWQVIRDKERCHRYSPISDPFDEPGEVTVPTVSEWPEEDWLNLLECDPHRYLTPQQDDLETERLLEIEENQEWYDQDLRREPLEDDDVYLSRIQVRDEYEYTTEDFAEEFFGGTDSLEWESLFP